MLKCNSAWSNQFFWRAGSQGLQFCLDPIPHFLQEPFWTTAAESLELLWRGQSRSNICCLSKTQNDTEHPAQPPLGCLGHRTHFSGWKADSDTASSDCVCSGSPCRRHQEGEAQMLTQSPLLTAPDEMWGMWKLPVTAQITAKDTDQ